VLFRVRRGLLLVYLHVDYMRDVQRGVVYILYIAIVARISRVEMILFINVLRGRVALQ
jgi:hypothetical protein